MAILKIFKVVTIVLFSIFFIIILIISGENSDIPINEAQYYYEKKVQSIVKKHGIRTKEIGSQQKGLAFYKMINLDNRENGQQLYLLYFDKNDPTELYTEEIWTYTKESGLYCLYSFKHPTAGKIHDLTTSFAFTKERTYLMKIHSYSSGLGTYPLENKFITEHNFWGLIDREFVNVGRALYLWEGSVVDENQFQEIFFISYADSSEKDTMIKVSEIVYKDFLLNFGAENSKPIMISEAGEFKFGFEITVTK